MPSRIDAIASGECQAAIQSGLTPYSQALLRRQADTADQFLFDVTVASRPGWTKLLAPYAAGILMCSSGVQLVTEGQVLGPRQIGMLDVFVLPPGYGTGSEHKNRAALNGTDYPPSAIPYERMGLSRGIRTEAVFGIIALANGATDAVVPHAMRLEKTVIHPDSGRVVRAAMLGQSEADFEATMQDRLTAAPAATLTIADFGETAGGDMPWQLREEALLNSTRHTLIIGRLAVFADTDDAALNVFTRLEARPPIELAA